MTIRQLRQMLNKLDSMHDDLRVVFRTLDGDFDFLPNHPPEIEDMPTGNLSKVYNPETREYEFLYPLNVEYEPTVILFSDERDD